MRRTLITVATTLAAAAGLTVGAVTTSSTAQAAPGAHGQKVCADAKAGEASCHAIKLVDADGVAVDANGKPSPSASTPPATGKTPAQIRGAYNLSGTASGGRTVAIVDAYGYPNAERDLGVYRAQFGLSACTKANGCLTIVNQSGGTSLPAHRRGLVAGAGARPRRRLGRVPRLQDPPRAGLVGLVRQPRRSGQHGGEARRCRRHLEQLRRRRRGRHVLRQLLQPPRHRGDRLDGRQRLPGRLLPGLVLLRHGGRRHVAQGGLQHPRLDRDRVERRGLGLLDPQHGARRGVQLRHRLRQARDGRRLGRRRPQHGSRGLRADHARRRARGRSTAGRACPRRSSRRSTRSAATPRATPTRSPTPTRPASTT